MKRSCAHLEQEDRDAPAFDVRPDGRILAVYRNLRPVLPSWHDRRTAMVWMRRGYKANHGEWCSSAAAAIVPTRSSRWIAATS